ncbi:MAG: FAD-dependent oxidoreductase [Pirellulales bacterium]
MLSISRRDLMRAALGASAAALVGCERPKLAAGGELLSQDFATGHRLRDPNFSWTTPEKREHVPVLIIGGGIAGLSAAWRLRRKGLDRFRIIELEAVEGGTSRSGQTESFRYPWAAHYITTPMASNIDLIDLLKEMGVVEGLSSEGEPIVGEQWLCREPEERLYQAGTWVDGLYPSIGADEEDLREMREFQEAMKVWAEKRDASGRRLFTIPIAACSDDTEARELDQLSMLEWMQRQGWSSSRLTWYVDYACRDDYGLPIDRTSAWAGVFYFASRLRPAAAYPQDVITWPAGNGFIVDYLKNQCRERLVLNQMAFRMEPAQPENEASVVKVDVFDKVQNEVIGLSADRVIFAAPQFVAKRMLGQPAGLTDRSAFQYGAWITANVHLRSRPRELLGAAMAWDNVIYDSKSLGYVVSTHQTGADYGPTVITWYYPITDTLPQSAREQLLKLEWHDWADICLTDLEQAHEDIRGLITRIDIMRWGHAMIQPVTGFMWSDARRRAAEPIGRIHFANTDLSGIPLMEEAFHHGLRAADEVLSGISSQ